MHLLHSQHEAWCLTLKFHPSLSPVKPAHGGDVIARPTILPACQALSQTEVSLDFKALIRSQAFATRCDAGLERQQCNFDEASGQLVINGDVTRVAAQCKLLDAAMKAFVEGAADVPSTIAETGNRLLPQLWNKQKIAARQMTLPQGFEVPHCGLRGELPVDGDLGIVLVCIYEVDGISVDTPVLSNDLSRWSLSFTAALEKALENLRARTKKGPPADRRWEHHPSGCGESCWKDRFDAVRVAVFPKLVATRKRPDGVAEQGSSNVEQRRIEASHGLSIYMLAIICVSPMPCNAMRFLSLAAVLPASWAVSCTVGSRAQCGHGVCRKSTFSDKPFFNECECDFCWTGAGDCDANLCLFFGLPLGLFICFACMACIHKCLLTAVEGAAIGAGAAGVASAMSGAATQMSNRGDARTPMVSAQAVPYQQPPVYQQPTAYQQPAAPQVPQAPSAPPVQKVEPWIPPVPPSQAPKTFMVQCPQGALPGTLLEVATPDGSKVQVTVPPGVAEGQQFSVQY
eukprot:symbB.v1.2.015759.t3/scaffold1187.1/size155418/8